MSVVLLVDDEPRILSALQRSLRREAYDVVQASDARGALEILEQQPIDLVLSDHKMPGLSGVQLLKMVAERWPATTRILMSGWSGEIPDAELDAAGLHALLPKPWDEDGLKDAIRAAIADS